MTNPFPTNESYKRFKNGDYIRFHQNFIGSIYQLIEFITEFRILQESQNRTSVYNYTAGSFVKIRNLFLLPKVLHSTLHSAPRAQHEIKTICILQSTTLTKMFFQHIKYCMLYFNSFRLFL